MKHLIFATSAVSFLLPILTCEGATRYHVRPFTTVAPGAISDGLIENAATSNSLQFSDASKTTRASADLDTGELKVFAGINNSIAGVSALAEYSETFTLRSGAGSFFEFHFDFDGEFSADRKSVPEGGIYQLQLSARFAVFGAGEADWNTWFDKAFVQNTALFADTFQYSADNTAVDVEEFFNESLSYETLLDSDFEQFHVFARIQVVVNANTPQTASFDFLNTGTLGFESGANVEVFSASGVFPNTQPVPEPTTGVLATLGLSLLMGRRRGRGR